MGTAFWMPSRTQSVNQRMMQLSVIIPTYKPTAYVADCLESLSKQQLDRSQFEVIIVLNGCREPYEDYLRSEVSRVGLASSVVFLQTDIPGVSNARNIALNCARGRYVTFVDDDDCLSPSYLSDMLGAVQDEHDVVVTNVVGMVEVGGTVCDDYIGQAYRALPDAGSEALFAHRSLLSSSCCKLIPKSLIADRRFDHRFAIGEDALFMATVSDAIHTLRKAPASAVYYRRIREQSASRKPRTRLQIARNSLALSLAYMKVYCSAPTRYSLPFFLSRIAAVLWWIVK